MDGPVVGPADQGQVGQVGGAAIQPMLNVVGFAPREGPLAVGEHTAAVADSQGKALGGLDHPGAAAEVQGLAGGPTQDGGQQGDGGSQLGFQGWVAAGAVHPGWMVLATGIVLAVGIAIAVLAVGIAIAVLAVVAGMVVAAGIVLTAGIAVALLAVVAVMTGGLAGDQDPGQRPVTGQPPTRLRAEGAGVGDTPHHPRTPHQAV
jgi:hypothetical protein